MFAMRFRLLFVLTILFPVYLNAQLCNNNLGDPIVNVTFGAGSAFPPNTTTYSYVRGCPSKGEYTINNFLFGCGGSWVQLTGDHTGNVNGNYMLVDAESTPGIVHVDTAFNLCENMTYQYSAYITNVLQDNLSCGASVVLPSLTFTILSLSGKLLATYNTGDLPITNEKLWKQYGLTYKTTAGINAVILKISTNPPYGCGSAFALDDIVFQNCGPSVKVTIDGDTTDQNVCADYTNPFIMQGTYSSGFANPVVQWQNSFDTGKTWTDIAGATTTTYQVPHRTSGAISYRMVVAEKENIQSVNCRIRSNAIYTEIHPLPLHNSPRVIGGCSGKDYMLPATDPSALQIQWLGPNGFTYNIADPPPVITNLQYADTGLYKLYQTFYFGCTTNDSFYLKVSPGITISTQSSHSLCEGSSETLGATASANGTFEWSPATGLSDATIPYPVASPTDSTIYKVIVTNAEGCADSALLTVNVYKLPVVTAGDDKTILAGDTATLDGSVSGTSINFFWTPSSDINDINTAQPKVYPSQNTTYTLTATSSVGCGSASDNVNVNIVRGIFIPNSFTPNGDGRNDRFRIAPFENYQILQFVIYNRWGNKVFNSTNAGEGWDGTYKGLPQPIGAYIYYIELKSTNGKKIVKQGTITLLR